MSATAAAHHIRELPIMVLLPHNRCNCRCVMCDIWKIRRIREVTAEDLRPHLAGFRALKVQWVVLSGGEPLLHSDLWALCRLLRAEGLRVTLLTAGLDLDQYASLLCELVDDVIVSIDGPPAVHDAVRGIPGAFQRLERGVRLLRHSRPEMRVCGRCTVQKKNFGHLRSTVSAARRLQLNSLSFLAADVTSTAFNREEPLPANRRETIALTPEELDALDHELDSLIRENCVDIDSGFVSERPEKLRRIADHFRAQLGLSQAIAPRCNAPWVSTVIEADGTVRPCFFQPAIGNIQSSSLLEILNGEAAVRFRRELDVATNSICRNCVCSLYLSPDSQSRAS
jgi:MoaA/NifB/PqqE/SkfB family radical SAM enzyme